MIQDKHHIRLISDRVFDENLNFTKVNSSTIKNLKITLMKWKFDDQIDLKNARKTDLVKHIEKIIKENLFVYHRICIKPTNGKNLWFESSYDIRSFNRQISPRKSKTDLLESYLLKSNKNWGGMTEKLRYDATGDQWISEFEAKKTTLVITNKDDLKVYYDNLRTVLIYVEKRNAYLSSLLFEKFLNKDIISYIKTFI